MRVKQYLKSLWGNKTARILLLASIALILLACSYFVFGAKEKETSGAYAPTAQEERVAALLSEIKGVDGATVMITQEDGKCVGAVVVFDGEDGILVRLKITQIAAKALSVAENRIYVYPSDKK